jgi:predicted ABC-type ATPase
MMQRSPQAVIIAGPNGAGKSTLAPRLLAGELEVLAFVNADVIAQGLAAFNPEMAAVEAGRTMLKWISELARSRVDFAFETTLSGLGLQHIIGSLHNSGYSTHLVYLWLPNPELAVERVRRRVQLGGHQVQEVDIRRRYFRSVHNFEVVYRGMVHRWQVRDATGEFGRGDLPVIARGTGSAAAEIYDPDQWQRLQDRAAEPED